MKRKKVDSRVERQILTALITSREFLIQVSPVMDLNLLNTDHFRQIAEWSLNYFNRYHDAPGAHIESIYHSWVESGERDDDQTEIIHDFLASLSEQHDTAGDINVPYLVEETAKFLNLKRLSRVRDDLEYSLSSGDSDAAMTVLTDFKSIELGNGSGIDILNDESVWDRAFSESAQTLIRFKDENKARFFGNALSRDTLIGIQGPEKRGKTWWCVEFAIHAIRNRRKVALFEVGDMSESQIVRRMGVRLSGLPLELDYNKKKFPIPKKIEKTNDPDELPNVEYKYKKVSQTLSKKHAQNAIRRLMRGSGIPKNKSYLLTSIHSNSSINVREISGILDRWALEKDFIPDVVIIDYADILAPEDRSKQSRDQVNDTWKALRRLSQDKHCLVIAPTQADSKSYDTKTQSMKNFSEDKRKNAHVTGMLGLNQTPEEKDAGLMRLNWIALREGDFSSWRCLYVGQCFKLGKIMSCTEL